MKDFDYDKAYAGAAVCTKDGIPVRIVCWDADIRFEGNTYPILALVSMYKDKVADEVPVSYTEDGKGFRGSDSRLDLAMVPVKHEGWVIIDKGSCFSEIHESKEKAMEFAEREEYDYTAIAHIEWEE